MSEAKPSRALIAAVGLNPLRVVRAAMALGSTHLVLLVTPSASFAVEQIAQACRELELSVTQVLAVTVDEWVLSEVLTRVEQAANQIAELGVIGVPDVLVAGGTKPIVVTCALIAEAWSDPDHTWTTNDSTDIFANASGHERRPPALASSLSLDTLASLHAGLWTDPSPGAHADLAWLRSRLHRPAPVGRTDRQRSDSGESGGLKFEAALELLLRQLLPQEFHVHGAHSVVLRDPLDPQRAAFDPRAGSHGDLPVRRFEVDGVVICGARAWAIEAKFRNLKLRQAFTAYAEIDRRRRDLGGDTTRGILVFLSDETGDRLPEGPQPFAPAGVDVVTTRGLLQALDYVEGRDSTRPELLDLFTLMQ